jgi:hypothetical protein
MWLRRDYWNLMNQNQQLCMIQISPEWGEFRSWSFKSNNRNICRLSPNSLPHQHAIRICSAFMPSCNLLLDRPFFHSLSFFTINYQAVRLVVMS